MAYLVKNESNMQGSIQLRQGDLNWRVLAPHESLKLDNPPVGKTQYVKVIEIRE